MLIEVVGNGEKYKFMKIDPIIKEFLNREDIQDIINEGDIDKVFGEFYNYIDYYISKVDSIGKLKKQL